MENYQKLFQRCSQHWTGRGGRETKFVLSMFNNFVILTGMISRVLSKIVAGQDLSFECLTIRPANAMHLCKITICSSSGHTFWGQTRREIVFYIFSLWCFSCCKIKKLFDWHFLRSVEVTSGWRFIIFGYTSGLWLDRCLSETPPQIWDFTAF
jgi:hypothetical protein